MSGTGVDQWVLLALAAVIVGISKTAMPAVSPLAVALFAWQLSPRAATGALLVLLLVGDLIAVATYRRHADWGALRRLLPAVLVGFAVGAAVLAVSDNAVLRRLIGLILLGILGLTVTQRWRARPDDRGPRPVPPAERAQPAGGGRAGVFGALGGFTTMTANVGGPVMSVYFLASRLPVTVFLGTAAWFFLVINLIKLPVTVGLGLLGWHEFFVVLPLVPGVVLGAWVGRRGVRLINRSAFEVVVAALTFVSAIVLVI